MASFPLSSCFTLSFVFYSRAWAVCDVVDACVPAGSADRRQPAAPTWKWPRKQLIDLHCPRFQRQSVHPQLEFYKCGSPIGSSAWVTRLPLPKLMSTDWDWSVAVWLLLTLTGLLLLQHHLSNFLWICHRLSSSFPRICSSFHSVLALPCHACPRLCRLFTIQQLDYLKLWSVRANLGYRPGHHWPKTDLFSRSYK